MRTLYFKDNAVKMIDQSKLPKEYVIHSCQSVDCLISAIKSLKVRGAPALGVSGAYGVLLSAMQHKDESKEIFIEKVMRDSNNIANARPTAINLQWGVNSQLKYIKASLSNDEIIDLLFKNAEKIADDDIKNNLRIGDFGASLIDEGDNILTHCNAGSLACVGYGTALGIIRSAHAQRKRIHVYVDETRPLCQGSRLTAWELYNENIPATLITDSMAGFLMKLGKVQKVVVGADRIASNGDVANKIGTYSLSILAKHHNIPFIVAAPTHTIDYELDLGSKIPIEERDGEEIKLWHGIQNAPLEIDTFNPAFDVTPSENVHAIVTEKGIAKWPYEESLASFRP